jgi:hypothetical protein
MVLLARARAKLDRDRRTLARDRSWLEREARESQRERLWIPPVAAVCRCCWVHLLDDFGSNQLRVGSSLGMEAMKAQAIVFDDDSGRSLIIYRTGVFCWSYSIDGVPVGKTFLTRKRAIKAALSKSVLLPKRSWEKMLGPVGLISAVSSVVA